MHCMIEASAFSIVNLDARESKELLLCQDEFKPELLQEAEIASALGEV